ncbi:MAG: hypothetical protein AABY89_12940 [Acidobacteriota bacterium]
MLAPRALEQLALLTLLVGDADPAIRAAAEETLRRIPSSMLASFLARPDVPPELREFFGARGVEPSDASQTSSDEPLVATELPDQEPAPELDVAPGEPLADGAPQADAELGEGGEVLRLGTIQRLARMNVTEKIKVAMRGTREERAILIRDPNKLVSISVLASPKLTDREVEGFAKLAAVSEDVLRVIGTTRAWMKSYGVVQGLVKNPKTPVSISLGLVIRLIEKDLKAIATDRNLPDPIKLLARRLMQGGQARRR